MTDYNETVTERKTKIYKTLISHWNTDICPLVLNCCRSSVIARVCGPFGDSNVVSVEEEFCLFRLFKEDFKRISFVISEKFKKMFLKLISSPNYCLIPQL